MIYANTKTDIHHCIGIIEARKMKKCIHSSGNVDWFTSAHNTHHLMPHSSGINNCIQTSSKVFSIRDNYSIHCKSKIRNISS